MHSISIISLNILSVISICWSLQEGGVSEQHHGCGEAPGEPFDSATIDRDHTHPTLPPASRWEERHWGQRGSSVSKPRGMHHISYRMVLIYLQLVPCNQTYVWNPSMCGLCFHLIRALCITNRKSMRESLLGKKHPSHRQVPLLRSLRPNLRWLPKLWLTKGILRPRGLDLMEWSSEEWLFINRSLIRWWQMMGSLVRTVS